SVAKLGRQIMKILVLNCGSSSIKFQLIETDRDLARSGHDRALAKGQVENIGGMAVIKYESLGEKRFKETAEILEHRLAVDRSLALLSDPELGAIRDRKEVGAVGHRVVHGGERFSSSARIDAEVLAAIEDCFEMAPLHNPANVRGYRAAQAVLPEVPHVAV